jgi:hypothetical protein
VPAVVFGPGSIEQAHTADEWIDLAQVDAAAESLVQADHYAISKGRIVPVRSRLLSAPATFALDWITGEPAPRLFQKGSIIPAGARNISSDPIDLEALEAWTDSRLASLLQIESGNEWRNAAMQKLIRTYLTTGEKETRAWTITEGTKAPGAAGVIHGDFERGFIAAEIVHYDDLVSLGSHAKAREAGKLRIEGKEYVMKDGDVVEFRFNV